MSWAPTWPWQRGPNTPRAVHLRICHRPPSGQQLDVAAGRLAQAQPMFGPHAAVKQRRGALPVPAQAAARFDVWRRARLKPQRIRRPRTCSRHAHARTPTTCREPTPTHPSCSPTLQVHSLRLRPVDPAWIPTIWSKSLEFPGGASQHRAPARRNYGRAQPGWSPGASRPELRTATRAPPEPRRWEARPAKERKKVTVQRITIDNYRDECDDASLGPTWLWLCE